MKISFLKELHFKIRSRCSLCHEYKLLEYLVMDEKNDMFSVCRECKEKRLEPGNFEKK